jgi:hypothetical protein
MGSFIEINDTLQITTEQGFPKELDLERHEKKPFTLEDFQGKIFEFKNKPNLRIYHSAPLRCFLVHNINGKWLYWGHCNIIEQTLHAKSKTTSGKFIITKIYPLEYQKLKCKFETDSNNQYFDE